MRDEYDFTKFREAQGLGVYEEALEEIKAGKKKSHWMWFIFPQLLGLGSSPTAKLFGIKSEAEAKAYLADPLLGSRFRKICQTLLAQENSDPYAIFGTPDDLKLQSSMTLFDKVSPNDVFAQILEKFYQGERDRRSLEMLNQN